MGLYKILEQTHIVM